MLALWLMLVGGTAFAGDKDKDGVSNKEDACKDVPEDRDGFEDADGCPDPDNDQDGVDDVDDKCPGEPEDADGHEDDDGCPDLDDDHDFVPDTDDQCPLEKEDQKGAADGCPDIDFTVLTEQGWMKSVSDLMGGIFDAASKQGEGCGAGATHVRAWLDTHDPEVELKVFEAQLSRRPEYLEEQTFRDLLAGKGASYPSLQKALSIFCKDNAAWQGVQPDLDAVMQPWMPTAEAE